MAVAKRPSTVAYTGSTTAAFGWVELSAWVGDGVDLWTARLAGREVRFETGGQVFVATTDAEGMPTVADPVLLVPGTHQANVRVLDSAHYLEWRPGQVLGGPVLDGASVQRLCCDAGVHRAVRTGRSAILDYGTTTGTVPLPAVVSAGGARPALPLSRL